MFVASLKEEKEEIYFNRNDIFQAYKRFSQRFSSIDEEIKALGRYVDIYRCLDFPWQNNNPCPGINYGIFHHDKWQNRDFYPILFVISDSKVSVEEKQKMIKLLESYVIRRGICGLSAQAYNKNVARFCKELGDHITYDSFNTVLKSAQADTIVFPDDERVEKEAIYVSFYKSPFRMYVFEWLEKSMQDRSERGEFNGHDLSIDHILPQAWDIQDRWKAMVQERVEVVQRYINTIGNLTLMSQERNVKKSNRTWEHIKSLLLDSPIKLNRELADKEKWDVEEIMARSKRLARRICEIWPYDIE